MRLEELGRQYGVCFCSYCKRRTAFPCTSCTKLQTGSWTKDQETADMAHDKRILQHEEHIEALRETIPSWVKDLQRPPTPLLIPRFGPLEGIRVVSSGIIVAQPYIG